MRKKNSCFRCLEWRSTMKRGNPNKRLQMMENPIKSFSKKNPVLRKAL